MSAFKSGILKLPEKGHLYNNAVWGIEPGGKRNFNILTNKKIKSKEAKNFFFEKLTPLTTECFDFCNHGARKLRWGVWCCYKVLPLKISKTNYYLSVKLFHRSMYPLTPLFAVFMFGLCHVMCYDTISMNTFCKLCKLYI